MTITNDIHDILKIVMHEQRQLFHVWEKLTHSNKDGEHLVQRSN